MHGFGTVGGRIRCDLFNDATAYPADSFANMVVMAEKHDFPFPYLHDPDQSSRAPTGLNARPIFSDITAI